MMNLEHLKQNPCSAGDILMLLANNLIDEEQAKEAAKKLINPPSLEEIVMSCSKMLQGVS